LGGSAFIHIFTAWLIFPYSVLFLLGLLYSKNMKSVLIGSYGAGVIKAGIAISWLLTAYPLEWFPEASEQLQLIVIFGCWLGIALSIGLGSMVIGILFWHIRTSKVLQYAVLPVAILCSEILGSFFLSVYTYGTNVGFNTEFGFSISGYALADHALLKYGAIIGGVFFLGLLLGCLTTAFIYVLSRLKSTNSKLLSTFVTLILFILTGYWSITPAGTFEGELLASVETAFTAQFTMSTEDLVTRQQELFNGVTVALEHGAKTVLLPEDARLSSNSAPEYIHAKLADLPHREGALVVDSARVHIQKEYTLQRAYIYDLDSLNIFTADKRYIVPMGEYLPYLHAFFVNKLGGRHLFADLQNIPSKQDIPSDTPSNIPNIIFCFESSSPWITSNKQTVRKANLIVHPVSHGWFHTPFMLWHQERQALIVQSLYTQTPILQSGNLAPNLLFLPDGTVDSGRVVSKQGRHLVRIFGR
jgi:apolipoprotein N-acyltransferase